MSHSDDFDDVIAAEIPDDLVEELIRGAFEPELPSELMLVGRVLRAAHGPIPGEDRERETEVIEAMLAAMTVTPIAIERPSNRWRRRGVLVAVSAAVSVLGVGGVAAAAGSLPTPIQSFVHDSLSHVGVSVPSTEDAPTPPEPETTDNSGAPEPDESGSATGPDANAPGQSGTAPGQSGNTPGQSGNTPGQSGNAPGQSGATSGQSGSEPPGQSGSTPGQSGSTPGQSGDATGQSEKKPSESDLKSGQAENEHTQSNK